LNKKIDVMTFYTEVIEAKIPFNLWYSFIERRLMEVYESKKKMSKTRKTGFFRNCFFLE